MAVPAPSYMLLFGPGVGIKQVLALRIEALLQHQPPEIDQVGAHADRILRNAARPVDSARQAVRRLIDADYEMIGKAASQMQGGPSNTASRIQNQRLAAARAPCVHARVKGGAVVRCDRLAKGGSEMPLQPNKQMLVHLSLRADDEAGVGVHCASIPIRLCAVQVGQRYAAFMTLHCLIRLCRHGCLISLKDQKQVLAVMRMQASKWDPNGINHSHAIR